MKRIALFLLLFIPFYACVQKKTAPKSLVGVNDVIVRIDSALTSIPACEYQDNMPENPYNLTSEDMQTAYDQAKLTWAQFKVLCEQEEYREALSFYYAYNDELKQPNSGDFLLHLRHSTYRYSFFSEVLRPLLHEYWGEPAATEEYVKVLQLEKALEDITKGTNEDGTRYVPEVYTDVVRDLGFGLAAIGNVNEAISLKKDFVLGFYVLHGDAFLANFMGTDYVASLYDLVGERGKAKETWENYRDYLLDNRADFSEVTLELCMQDVEASIRDYTD